MERSGTLQENEYCKGLKLVSDVDKEYIDKHKSDRKVLQCDRDEASVESEESHNEELLNLARVFEASKENLFSIEHSSRFGKSVTFNRRYLY